MNMFKSLVSATVLSAVTVASGAALGAEWETVARAADETVFVDLDSLRISGAQIEAKVIHNFVQPRNLGTGWYEHRSRVMAYRFDCVAETLAFTAFEMKTGELGSGETVFSGVTSGDMFPASADVVDTKMIAKVCNPANVARSERQGTADSRLARR